MDAHFRQRGSGSVWPTFVYFLRPVGADGPIKIGCSRAPDKRLQQAMGWSPVELEIIARIEGGDADLEKNLHDCFFHLHIRSEWFEAGPDLQAALLKIQAGVPVHEAVDLSKRTGSVRGKKRGPLSAEAKLRVSYSRRFDHALNRTEKAVGTRLCWPKDVETIMARWIGHWQAGWMHHGPKPTAAEFARLDEALAEPRKHCVAAHTRRAA